MIINVNVHVHFNTELVQDPNNKKCALQVQFVFVHQNIQQRVLAEAPTKESSATKNFQGSIL